MKNINNGDLVLLKCGERGVISDILYNMLGDGENIYQIRFLNNKTAYKRSKDFLEHL